MPIFLPLLHVYNHSRFLTLEPRHHTLGQPLCLFRTPAECHYSPFIKHERLCLPTINAEVLQPRLQLEESWRGRTNHSFRAAKNSGLRNLLWRIPLSEPVKAHLAQQSDQWLLCSENAGLLGRVKSSTASWAGPLLEDLTADVRIFFNAGWRLEFELVVTGVDAPEAFSPAVSLKMESCIGELDTLAFRVIKPTTTREVDVCRLEDGRLEVCGGADAARGLAILFRISVNHLFEDDNYTDWRRLYAEAPSANRTKNGLPQKMREGRSLTPFHKNPSQLSLQVCYYDSITAEAGQRLGRVNFVLVPSDGIEFVLFSIIGLVGMPMLLMMGFRCLAQKHASLRQDIVKCIAGDKLFAQQLVHYLKLPELEDSDDDDDTDPSFSETGEGEPPSRSEAQRREFDGDSQIRNRAAEILRELEQ